MPPFLALLLTLGFIAYLFWRDVKERPNITAALWVPVLWMLLIGSRFVSEWLNLGTPAGAGLEDGSPIDRVVFMGLIAAGVVVLGYRRVRLIDVVRNNVWLSIFFVYCFLAIFWSDFPFVAFKRWIKILGHPVMALIVLTEPDVEEAVRRLMRRCAYVLLPVSILFIKYFPELGRRFDIWTGAPVNIGITADKNALGYDCMILGVFFVYLLLRAVPQRQTKNGRADLNLSVAFLAMALWLLSTADSKTSLICLMVAVALMLAIGQSWVSKKYIGINLVLVTAVFATVEMTFGVYASIIEMLGRDASLTDRTDIWAEVLKIDINPILGAGFESFWLGERLDQIWAVFWFHPNQAHNGYLETYLNLGLIGLFLLISLAIATFRKTRRELLTNFHFGRFRMALLLAILVYNYTEATFKAVHLVWFAFYIIALEYPQSAALAAQPVAAKDSPQVTSRWAVNRKRWGPGPSFALSAKGHGAQQRGSGR